MVEWSQVGSDRVGYGRLGQAGYGREGQGSVRYDGAGSGWVGARLVR